MNELVQQLTTVPKDFHVHSKVKKLFEQRQEMGSGTKPFDYGMAELVAFAELAFEPFYPQCRAAAGFEQLAEPIPGPTTEAFATATRRLGVVVVLNLFERDGSRFTFESPQPIRVRRKRRRQDLDGDMTAEAWIVRKVDLAHPTGPEEGHDLVGAKPGAGSE